MGTSIFCRKHRVKSRLSIKWYHVYAASTSAIEHVYRATCINFRTKCQSTVVQSISSSSTAGPGVPSDQRTCPQTKLWTSSGVASSSTRGTSPLMPIIQCVTRRVASVIVCSLRDIATIHSHRMPGDERSCIRAEPHHRFRHFFWGTDPSDGLSGNDLCFLLGIAQTSCGHRRLDVAWADAIDPDTLLRILQRCCFRQSDHTMFTGNIGGNASATD